MSQYDSFVLNSKKNTDDDYFFFRVQVKADNQKKMFLYAFSDSVDCRQIIISLSFDINFDILAATQRERK